MSSSLPSRAAREFPRCFGLPPTLRQPQEVPPTVAILLRLLLLLVTAKLFLATALLGLLALPSALLQDRGRREEHRRDLGQLLFEPLFGLLAPALHQPREEVGLRL